ncbi:retrotransposon protein, putative, ty1-copia subclass, partial [Tanacetum coccineum]
KILANRLSSAIGSLVSNEQSDFIRGRQILDGLMMLSEVIDWCNQENRKAMIFRVDFKKAYDSVRWDFLDMILYRFDFGGSWRGLIKGYLVSSTALILVNGSPTLEFYFQQGLRQGDLLSLFLFLLVMESLHISFIRAMEGGFFLRNPGVRGVKYDEVIRGAHLIGCEAAKTSFKYLGVMAKTLSIGGRFTLTKAVLSTIPLYFFSLFKILIGVLKHHELCRSSFFLEPGVRKASWFSWDSVVASKEVRGLGMSSFLAMNHALLFKWIWRFKAHPEAMWVSIIKAIHRPCASAIVSRFLGWWGLPDIGISSYQGWLNWFDGLRLRKEVKDYLEGNSLSTELDDTMNKDTPVVVATATTVTATTHVVDMTVEKEKCNTLDDTNVEKEKLCSLEDTSVMGSFPPLPTQVTTSASNAPGKSSYANITGKPSGKKVNVRTLFTPEGNRIDVLVLVDSIHAINKRFANIAYSFFLGKKVAYPVVANYVRNTCGKYGLIRSIFSSSTRLFSFQFSSMDGLYAMLENGPWFIRNNPLIFKKWHPDKNLLKEDVSIVPVLVKFHGVPVTAFSEDGLSAIATKLANVELKDNIVVAMPKSTRDGHYTCNVRVEYEWKPPRCSSCKVFRHIHEECPKNTGSSEKKTMKKPNQTSRGVLSAVSFSGNKKKGVKPTIEVSNSNSFDVLNSVDNDVEFDNSSSGTTPIIDKIGKFEDLLTSGQAILVDKAGNHLKKVEFSDEYDSEDEVASIDNDMARSMAFERVDFGTQSLLEQWRDSYGNGDYDDNPYDDDMYGGQDLSHELQAI